MEVVGVVKDGRVEIPASVRLPEGTRVRVVVDAAHEGPDQPFEREALTEKDVLADIAMATGKLFRS